MLKSAELSELYCLYCTVLYYADQSFTVYNIERYSSDCCLNLTFLDLIRTEIRENVTDSVIIPFIVFSILIG